MIALYVVGFLLACYLLVLLVIRLARGSNTKTDLFSYSIPSSSDPSTPYFDKPIDEIWRKDPLKGWVKRDDD